MKKFLLALVVVLYSTVSFAQGRITQAHKERAAAIVSQMTLEEKCRLIHGQNKNEDQYSDGFHIMNIDRLGIPAIRMADGPQGVRNKTNSTYYPCGISLAASFNRQVAYGVGEGIGSDARARGVAIMLCPGVNIYRSALCGRNFEYYGEDPYLSSETAVGYIKGIQDKNVMATVKHFALNNQEFDRHAVSSNADERSMNELYFPAFKKAVQVADVACVMTSYNPVNGVHAAENPWLIEENLRAWGFDGLVMSDWTSTYTTLGCLTSGLDLEMPRGYVLNYDYVKPFVENGVVDESCIDRMCQHILQTVIAYGYLDNPVKDESIPLDYDLSRANALAAALEGPTLLKNDGILPLKGRNIVVLGPNADTVPFGGGSGRMDPIEGRNITLYAGLKALGKKYNVSLMDWKNIDEKVLAKADAVILAVGFNHDTETENSDRTYSLPAGQNELIQAVAAVNSNSVVVVYSGGEVDVNPWIDSVKGLFMAWYPGQEGGTAMAQLLSGKASPSGRLPFTFWGSLEANPCMANYHKSTALDSYNRARHQSYPHVEYQEGVFVGYRGVERFGVKPMFPFGYGLTYSSFSYSAASVKTAGDGYDVTFTVKNTGRREASEVAQVYVAPIDSKVVRPHHELKGYEKVRLAKGESKTVTIHLGSDAFAHYDAVKHDWVVAPGSFEILVGPSSGDLQTAGTVVINERAFQNPISEMWYADPEAVVYDDEVWIFPTWSQPYDNQLHFDAFSSKDLKSWKRHKNVLTQQGCNWVRRALWAPAAIKHNDKYYIFFGANDIHEGEYGGIGVAVADKPEGPYTDLLGKPLIGEIINGAQPIDQCVFRDDDGTVYMYYGGWRHCNMSIMNSDLTGFVPFEDGQIFHEVTPANYVEGPFMLKRNGKYYFMWSEGRWTRSDYKVAYAISDTPYGPFERVATILEEDPQVGTGAGHHSVILAPDGEYYIVYHRHPLGSTDGNCRVVCIDRLYFNEDGTIVPVKMTK